MKPRRAGVQARKRQIMTAVCVLDTRSHGVFCVLQQHVSPASAMAWHAACRKLACCWHHRLCQLRAEGCTCFLRCQNDQGVGRVDETISGRERPAGALELAVCLIGGARRMPNHRLLSRVSSCLQCSQGFFGLAQTRHRTCQPVPMTKKLGTRNPGSSAGPWHRHAGLVTALGRAAIS